MDKDYWRQNRKGPTHWPEDEQGNVSPFESRMSRSPFSSPKNELSFTAKLILTIALLLLCAMAYRYQSSIQSMLSGLKNPSPVMDAVPRTRLSDPVDQAYKEPAIPAPVERGQIYRCGNTYSNTQCTNGHVVKGAQNAPQREISVSKEIYLCKDIYERLTWESVACSANGRFMDRIARVPANVSWEEQVAIARQQMNKAHAIAAEQVVSVASRSSATASAASNECQRLEQSIRLLDAQCRSNSCSMRTLDDVREQRRAIRDRQFRISC
ncbi:hypothetical protein KUF54_07080 [Comamonas sp. Y33R10-2]|uniref:hypothetical protein n=1 Tax=Comamonas sp. Y33R10-2 TaxID=2853257 RepID=UPI001C5CAEDD|nr:hypothetical protein [Comamonas sp. Y33R10-2]QXZ10949.1 hypothetical protein KUF54_07080 [Comamonas sp. Y33R10-2]